MRWVKLSDNIPNRFELVKPGDDFLNDISNNDSLHLPSSLETYLLLLFGNLKCFVDDIKSTGLLKVQRCSEVVVQGVQRFLPQVSSLIGCIMRSDHGFRHD